jgi:glycosyltransferase involved in cell wall biosynthesis
MRGHENIQTRNKMDQSRAVNYPVVSVIIPTYNRESLITRSIQSVLNQSYQNFEIIVIDDSSTDGTKGIVESFSDKRIRYIQLEDNRGTGVARNIGIQLSKGEFIAFQDSDDEWLPEKLEKHMLVFEKELSNVGVVYSDMQRVYKNGKTKDHLSPTVVPDRLINPRTQFYQVYMLGIVSAVIKKECFHQVGYFNEKLPCLEDLELFIRLSKQYDFYHIQEPLVKYYKMEGVSNNIQAQYLARELLLKLYYKELKCDKTFLVKEYTSIYIGKNFSKRINRKAIGYYLRSIFRYLNLNS